MDIKSLTQDRALIFDGAMGTMLQAKGITPGEPPELWNLRNPQAILDIHKQYVEAGADVITTNTFQAHALKLGSKAASDEVIAAGVRLARESGAAFVALDIGPLGRLMEPLGPLTFDEAYGHFRDQMMAGAAAGADCIIIETVSDLYEMKAAMLAAKENTGLPVICSMTFQENGRTLTGADAVTAAAVMRGLGAGALGANCSTGPGSLAPIVKTMLEYASVPVIVQPNAGMPSIRDGITSYDMGPEEFAELTVDLVRAGARIIGGCCGTSPEYIRRLRTMAERVKPGTPVIKSVGICASGSRAVAFGRSFVEIGERLNPTGKKRLKKAIVEMDSVYITGEALNQINAGAQVLDVNVGLPEVDEAVVLPKITKLIQQTADTPLMLDSTSPEALEAAARVYNGVPVINSVNGKKAVIDAILPIAAKYGAMLVCLTLDEDGIPETADKRLEIAARIKDAALSYGIPRENLLIDCLTLTASAQQDQAMETVKAIRRVNPELGCNTVLGVSNISFGMPERDIITEAFLGTAIGAGLSAAIINPLSPRLREFLDAYDVLDCRDRDGARFTAKYAPKNTNQTIKPVEAETATLNSIITQGRKDEAAAATEALLNAHDSLEIINNEIIPALNAVGLLYEKGTIFLPQLLMSAQAAQNSFAVIKSRAKQASSFRGKILLATVQGDIHDIGKNIVKLLLENYGFEIIDLGKDVPPEAIIAAIREQEIHLAGLSALMTTTVKSMASTITQVKENGLDCAFIVGGAVLTPEYAKSVGADYYAKDAMEGVRIAEEFFKDEKIVDN
ncbi:MAG: homocysteine S-methyltransferase family protein [Clostridiales bacterium]|jgi:5-methyltetrahydrofolate--homocysteine methyltransferase|nr:homocysteine S-methyltransferase family protein [Clostridiales bacterium]